MKLSIPGKLYIAGEYGVIDGGHAILAPTRRSMHFDIRESHTDKVASRKLGVKRLKASMVPFNIWKPYTIALAFLKNKHIGKKPFVLTIQSDLETPAFKLGLGSSGALCTGIIKSILDFHGVKVSSMTLFKLSVLAQYDSSKQTSFGDLSVHAFGQWVLYRKFDEQWMRKHENDALKTLIQRPWKGLKILPFTPPSIYGFAVNSMTPSSSTALVQAYRRKVPLQERINLKHFTDQKTLSLHASLKGTSNWEILDEIQEAMYWFSHKQNLSIITSPLEEISRTLTAFEGNAKFSGAGGGDCVIAFFDSQKHYLQAKHHFIDASYLIIEIGGVIRE